MGEKWVNLYGAHRWPLGNIKVLDNMFVHIFFCGHAVGDRSVQTLIQHARVRRGGVGKHTSLKGTAKYTWAPLKMWLLHSTTLIQPKSLQYLCSSTLHTGTCDYVYTFQVNMVCEFKPRPQKSSLGPLKPETIKILNIYSALFWIWWFHS